jgi:hypothetical protein
MVGESIKKETIVYLADLPANITETSTLQSHEVNNKSNRLINRAFLRRLAKLIASFTNSPLSTQ